MNPDAKAVLRLALLIGLLAPAALGQASDWLALSKNARGTITGNALSMTLTANAECDQTQQLVPDQSQLVVKELTLNTNSNGLGTFLGLAQLVAPAGRVVLQGWLRGTIGINTRCGTERQCRLPGHLEGLFEVIPLLSARLIARGEGQLNNRQVAVLNFSADLDPRVASAVPIYDARLDGLISSPLPITEQVTIAPDKTEYRASEVVTALIANSSDETITAFKQQTYCTIVQVQVQVGEQWTKHSLCPILLRPTPVQIAPDQKLSVALVPPPSNPNPLPLGPGVYRLALIFQLDPGELSMSQQFTVTSLPFRITPAPPAGQVGVTTDRDAYDVRDTITVRITNDQDRPILTWDHKSYCVVVDLQRQVGEQWTNLAPCLLRSATRPLRIEAQQDYWLKLPPESVTTRPAPGVYRIEFSYYAVNDAGQLVGELITVYSPTFKLSGE